MAALDFPDNPATGDLYGSSGTVWRWDGARWASTAGASGARGRVAYAEVTATQGSISAAVDIAGLSVTWTADPTRTYRTMVCIPFYTSIANTCLGIYLSDAGGTLKQINYDVISLVTVSQTQTFAVVETGLSGSITRKLQAQSVVGGGVMTMAASPTIPAFILVEDITYEAGTSGGSPITPSVAQAPFSNGFVISAFNPIQLLSSGQIISPSSDYTINGTTGEIAVTKAGIYQAGFSFYFTGTTATAGWYVQSQLEQRRAGASVATAVVITSQASLYATCGGVMMVNMAAGDAVRVVAGVSGGNVTVGNSSWLHLERIA